jgi:hypothetical protein
MNFRVKNILDENEFSLYNYSNIKKKGMIKHHGFTITNELKNLGDNHQ